MPSLQLIVYLDVIVVLDVPLICIVCHGQTMVATGNNAVLTSHAQAVTLAIKITSARGTEIARLMQIAQLNWPAKTLMEVSVWFAGTEKYLQRAIGLPIALNLAALACLLPAMTRATHATTLAINRSTPLLNLPQK